jgi:hypothetical protein
VKFLEVINQFYSSCAFGTMISSIMHNELFCCTKILWKIQLIALFIDIFQVLKLLFITNNVIKFVGFIAERVLCYLIILMSTAEAVIIAAAFSSIY